MPPTAAAPTKNELNKRNARLRAATIGHMRLTRKCDDLSRVIMDTARRRLEVRAKVEEGLAGAFSEFAAASAIMSPEILEQSLLCPQRALGVEMKLREVFGVRVPEFTIESSADSGDIFPYGFAQTSAGLDGALALLSVVLEDMIELAALEKTLQLLTRELMKIRKRASTLENVVIERAREDLELITRKLETRDRATERPLAHVRSLLLQGAHEHL